MLSQVLRFEELVVIETQGVLFLAVKLFVLGRPGSGKSTASYCIAGFAWQKGWFVIRIRDYEILWQMFQADTKRTDTKPKQFHPTQPPYKGFDVIDFSVLDTALEDVEKRVRMYLPFEQKNELIIIEFARDDYGKALKLFSSDFLQNAYFLFIEADVETCIQRIYERATHPLTADDNFVSDYVLKNYYHKDNRQYILSQLKKEYSIDKQVELIDNMGSQQEFAEKVLRFAKLIFQQEMWYT